MADQDVGTARTADDPADTDALVAALSREARWRARSTRAFEWLYRSLVLACVAAYLVRAIATGDWTHIPDGFGLAMLLSWCGMALAWFLNRRSLALRAAKVGAVGSIGPLAEIAAGVRGHLSYPASTAEAAAAALTRLLPKLHASDAHLLTDPQRDALLCLLRGKDEILVEAILRSLQQIGDERFVPAVEELAAGKRAGRRDRVTREAAQACLPALRERVRQEQAASLLLRPAGAPDGTLLRPASGAAPADEALLLRASESDKA